jgi:hypothetical protein
MFADHRPMISFNSIMSSVGFIGVNRDILK